MMFSMSSVPTSLRPHPDVLRARQVLFVGFVLALAILAWHPARANDIPAQALVRSTADSFLARLRQDGNADDPQRVVAAAEELVLPHFNFEMMSRRALGRHWRDFTPEQRGRFVAEFRTLLLRTYATTLNDHRDDSIEYLPARELAPAVVRVRTSVAPAQGGAPVQIDYEVRQLGPAWQVCDVTLNGVSLVISYRAGFDKDIGTLGADGIIAQLAERNQAPM